MSKLEQLQAQLAAELDIFQNFLDDNKLAEAKEQHKKCDEIADKIRMQKELDAMNSANRQKNPEHSAPENAKNYKTASFIRAAIKKFNGASLSEDESQILSKHKFILKDALILPDDDHPTGASGEGYILPQDIQTKIHELIRSYDSIADVVGLTLSNALTGSIPKESGEDITGLLDFTDGTDMTTEEQFSFGNVPFAMHEYGAFVKLSNTLLALSDNSLISYVAKRFARKQKITENIKILAALNKDKTVRKVDGVYGLKHLITTVLDPEMHKSTVILTNQDGWSALEQEHDTNGRSLLQPDPTERTSMLFDGKYPVHMVSNTALPSTPATKTAEGYAPIIFGNLKEGVHLVKPEKHITTFASSSHAGFLSNVTVCRLATFLDAVQMDGSDKCYVAGKIKVAEKLPQ